MSGAASDSRGAPPEGAWALRLYGAAMSLIAPLMLLRLWWRGRVEPVYREALPERLGRGPLPTSTGRLWLHAVSLGETRAARALVEALRAHRPGLQVLLTHGTATGRTAGRALLRDGDEQAWLPWDSPGAVRRFLDRHRPTLGVLMETEVWPVLLHEAGRRQVPVLLANARLSERSLRRGQRTAALLRPAVRTLARVLAQTEEDGARFRAFGAARVEVCGNLKFDMAPDPALLARGQAWRRMLGRPVLLAASTREGEEAELITAWRTACAADPAPPLLLVVPRHPQRFDEVAALCQSTGSAVVRRSRWAASELPPPDALRADIWVGDSLGEMPLYYALADAALLGGSFAAFGGQNLIEAAACGCPLWMGPSTFNFADAAERAVAAGAATRVADMAAALAGALDLAGDPARRQRAAGLALAFAAAHRGAADRMAQAILAHWPTDAAARPAQR